MNVHEMIETLALITFNSNVGIQIEQNLANALIAIESLQNIYKISKSERALKAIDKINEKIIEVLLENKK